MEKENIKKLSDIELCFLGARQDVIASAHITYIDWVNSAPSTLKRFDNLLLIEDNGSKNFEGAGEFISDDIFRLLRNNKNLIS